MEILVRRVEMVLAAVVNSAVSVLKQAFQRERKQLGVCWDTLARSFNYLIGELRDGE